VRTLFYSRIQLAVDTYFHHDAMPRAFRFKCLQATVDKLKLLSDNVTLSITRQGDFHLVVRGTGVALGEGFPALEVLPTAVADRASVLE